MKAVVRQPIAAAGASAQDVELHQSWEAIWQELERLHGAERQRVEESQQLAATILTNMATGLVMLNTRGQITECNPAARTVLGHRTLVGRHYRDIFWPEWRPPLDQPPGMAAVEACLIHGQPLRRLQMSYQAPEGQKMVLGVGFSPIRTTGGSIGGAIILLTDLTEITALQQQVRLKENLAALGEMSAGIAHEFKNSLATISGYAQLIQAVDTPDEARQFASKIYNETRFLAKIVTDFLNFSRPLQMAAAAVNLRELLESCFAEIRDVAGVRLELEGDFPVVEADQTLLRQAFANLLRNGCEAMAGRGGRMLVRARRDTANGEPVVVLEFQDEGTGIAPENMEKVFIPFFTTKDTGTGLGLALVHKVIVNHSGKVSVDSVLGLGTTFTVVLPLSPAI